MLTHKRSPSLIHNTATARDLLGLVVQLTYYKELRDQSIGCECELVTNLRTCRADSAIWWFQGDLIITIIWVRLYIYMYSHG